MVSEYDGSDRVPPIKLPSPPVSPKKGRRISKDIVSKTMGFVYVRDHCTFPTLSQLEPAI